MLSRQSQVASEREALHPPRSAESALGVRNFLTPRRGRTAQPAPPCAAEGRQYRPPRCRGGIPSSGSWHPHLPFVPACLAAVLRLDGCFLVLRGLDFL